MTSRSSWKKSEQEVARFHNPSEGRRTPLSGINSGITHADCINVDGMFIEAKYRQSFALWKLYMSTKLLAKKEKKIPVVSIKEKGKKGFIDMIHSDFLDNFVQMYIRNREIVVEESSRVIVGERELTKLYNGVPSDISFLQRNLTYNSFNNDGTLKDDWNNCSGEKLQITIVFSEGFSYVLYGTFAHPFKKDILITLDDISKARRRAQ